MDADALDLLGIQVPEADTLAQLLSDTEGFHDAGWGGQTGAFGAPAGSSASEAENAGFQSGEAGAFSEVSGFAELWAQQEQQQQQRASAFQFRESFDPEGLLLSDQTLPEDHSEATPPPQQQPPDFLPPLGEPRQAIKQEPWSGPGLDLPVPVDVDELVAQQQRWHASLQKIEQSHATASHAAANTKQESVGSSDVVLQVSSMPERSRVETQCKVVVRLCNAHTDELARGVVPSLVLPRHLLARPPSASTPVPRGFKLRVTPILDFDSGSPAAGKETAGNGPPRRCARCVPREQKFAKARGNAVMATEDEERARLVVIHSPEELPFESGEVVVPVRFTCYSRHHAGSAGYVVRFDLVNAETDDVVASGVSSRILVTDDHKSRIRRTKAEGARGGGMKRRRTGDDASNSDYSTSDYTTEVTTDSDAPGNASRSLQPRVERCVPDEGPCTGGIDVTILGQHFMPNLDVWFGSSKAPSVTSYGAQTLLCRLPAAPGMPPQPGLVPVRALPKNFRGDPADVPDDAKTVWFRYKDDTNERVLAVALEVVNLQVTGSVSDADSIARRVLGQMPDAGGAEAPQGGSGGGGETLHADIETIVLKLLIGVIKTTVGAPRRRMHLTFVILGRDSPSRMSLLELALFGSFLHVALFLVRSGLADLDLVGSGNRQSKVEKLAQSLNFASVVQAMAARRRVLRSQQFGSRAARAVATPAARQEATPAESKPAQSVARNPVVVSAPVTQGPVTQGPVVAKTPPLPIIAEEDTPTDEVLALDHYAEQPARCVEAGLARPSHRHSLLEAEAGTSNSKPLRTTPRSSTNTIEPPSSATWISSSVRCTASRRYPSSLAFSVSALLLVASVAVTTAAGVTHRGSSANSLQDGASNDDLGSAVPRKADFETTSVGDQVQFGGTAGESSGDPWITGSQLGLFVLLSTLVLAGLATAFFSAKQLVGAGRGRRKWTWGVATTAAMVATGGVLLVAVSVL
jgi:IPT/TIG domain